MKTKILLLPVSLMLTLILFTPTISIAQGTWTKKADFPGDHRLVSSAPNFSIGTKGYVRSYSDIENPLTNFWEWDQATNIWTKKADCPTNSSVSISFSIGGKGYMGFGYDASTHSYSNEFWEYDPTTNSWTQKASLPTTRPRTWNIYFSIGTKGYIGIGTEWTQGETVLVYDQEFWEWDQETNVWTRKADFGGQHRLGAVCFSIGNKGYVGTGNVDKFTFTKDFWEWDQATNVWTQKADFGGGARNAAVGFSIGTKGYIGTGMDDFTPFNNYKDFWEWDQSTNVWTQKADFGGGAQYAAAGFSIGNKGYLGIGDFQDQNGNNFLSDFWEYNPSGVQESYTDIIPAGSTLKKLSSNQFGWAEGPVWYNDSVLLFVDDNILGQNIYQYNPVNKQISKWPTNSVGCGGLTCDKDGNLIACSSNIIMMNKAGQIIKTLASGYNGKPLNNPNDLIADDKGGVYFTDPAYFLVNPPQDKKAVYYIDPNGNVKRLIDEFAKPNGIILSPDGKKLYLEVPDSTFVYSWDVASDGSVSGKSQFALLHTLGGLNSESDGIAIDVNGNIYVADNMGIEVFSSNGVYITTILVPEKPSNCDFGGKDFKTLYITAIKNLYSIDLNYPGFAVSRGSGAGGVLKNSILNKPVVEIYPNPAKESLHVRLNPGKVTSIDILTLDGKKVSAKLNRVDETDIEINTQNLKSGMYLLQVVSKEGVVTGKFVIE